MIATEEQLLELLDRCGFDFRSNVSEIARRYPKQLNYGLAASEVIPFALRTPLIGDTWKIPVIRDLENDLPPTRYWHEFHPTQEARINHDRAEAQLRELFGLGEAGKSTNVYERNWKIGFFTIRVLTWPRELNLRSSNVFEGRNPNLWISANVSIEPEFPFIESTGDTFAPIVTLLERTDAYYIECNSQVYARRNRMPAIDKSTVAGLGGSDFVIRAVDRTIRVPLEQIRQVKHLRLTPGRFSGSSSLDLDTLFLNRHKVAVSVARGREAHSLDHAAKHLAGILGKPLSVQEYSDDG